VCIIIISIGIFFLGRRDELSWLGYDKPALDCGMVAGMKILVRYYLRRVDGNFQK